MSGPSNLSNAVTLRFSEVSFEYGNQKPILEESSFSVRRGSKITLMGQNGAGKSTIFQLINREIVPETGEISISGKDKVATARQIITREELDLSVREFFAQVLPKKTFNIDDLIKKALEIVNFSADPEKKVKEFSGGQQARLLLAQALIQDADILLLDEPTNNLDAEGIRHLTAFLQNTDKTCIVISHDADFLNSFTEGVLYLDIFTRKIEQYTGNYFNVLKEITARLERERAKNARLEKEIQAKKDKASYFGQKGGKMRDVARKMKDKVADLEEDLIDMRREDKTIRKFLIPCQQEIGGILVKLDSVSFLKNDKVVTRKTNIELRKKDHLLLSGPNGVGKTTLLKTFATREAEGEHIPENINIGYYSQDFSTLDFDQVVYESLKEAQDMGDDHSLRSKAASFLIDAKLIGTKVGALSEGQKGLLSFARLVLMEPGVIILDEPTNHINFRHIPVIAQALDKYEGAMILVSHVPEFVKQISINEYLDLGKL